MIFRPELAEKVLAGEKTVTRRVPSHKPRSPWYRERCALRPGRSYAVQPGRSKHSIGRVAVTSVQLVALGILSDDEARREGFANAAEFGQVWSAMHGHYDPTELVWRVEFRLIHPDDYPLWEGTA